MRKVIYNKITGAVIIIIDGKSIKILETLKIDMRIVLDFTNFQRIRVTSVRLC